MKIVVIGTINKDLILPFQNSPIESFGGIFYDVSVLNQLLGRHDEIIPVSFIGEDVDITIRAILDKLVNVSTEGLITLPEKNHKVILEYTSPQRRQEKSLFPFPCLEWVDIEPYLQGADMVIVNLITGWDLSLEAYQKLAKKFYRQLYTDIHYLVMSTDNLGRRKPAMPERVEDWLRGSRFVQMNSDELKLLSADSRNEVDFFNTYFKKDQIMMCTRGSAGATLVYRRDGMVANKHVPAYTIPRIVDTTGCGDAFGAAFVVKYVETGDIHASLEFAQLVGAANASLRGTNEMHRLREMMDQIESWQKPAPAPV